MQKKPTRRAAAHRHSPQQSEFALHASQISTAISKVSQKLQKLATLAKRTSMFDDPSQQIDELTGVIKHEVQAANDAIGQLQRLAGTRGEGGGRQGEEHAGVVVESLRARLRDATAEFKEVCIGAA